MKKLLTKFKKLCKEIWLGFKIAEENRHRNGWGKF